MTTTSGLTLRELNRATLARQMLLARERIEPVEAIERLVAMQAQWPRPPFLGLWSRVDGFAREQLIDLLVRRRVVRAPLLRATLHLVSSRDFLSLRPVLQPTLDESMRSILDARLDGVDVDRLLARARAILAARPHTFDELRDELVRDEPGDARAMGYAVRMRLPLVQVPVEGAPWAFPVHASFAPADAWLRRHVRSGPAPADDLVVRYLAAYGPATASDVQAWSGLSREAVAGAIERLRPHLAVFPGARRREIVDLPDAPRPGADVPAPVRFLPEHDNVITARADERFVAREHRPRVFLPALRIAPTVLVDGFVAGTWTLKAGKRAAIITISPFAPFPPRVRRAVMAEAEALARFAEPAARAHDVKIGEG